VVLWELSLQQQCCPLFILPYQQQNRQRLCFSDLSWSSCQTGCDLNRVLGTPHSGNPP
jgi:hypothetical protein